MRPPERGTRPRRATFAIVFRDAAVGLCDATLRERNLRLHLVLGVLAACAAAVLEMSTAERAVVVLCIGAVVAAEAANAAIEVILDVVLPGLDERARFAKDASAGAVLALAGTSVVVALAVLAPAAVHDPDPGTLVFAAIGAAAAAAMTFDVVLRASTRRRIAVDAAVAALALAMVLPFARSAATLGAAALLVAIAAGAAARRLAGRGPPEHVGG